MSGALKHLSWRTDVLLGKLVGRDSRDELTLFKSLGLAVEDLAAAHFVYKRAGETGSGVPVALGGRVNATP